MIENKKRILFLCVGNSCRSQMAEGLMRKFFGECFDVFSAGINPSKVNPKSIEVMREIDIDISKHISKSVNLFLNNSFDYVITVCDNARETCPIFSGEVKNKLHWSFEDPAEAKGTEGQILKKFREVRDLIKDRILTHFKSEYL
jgi:arsenate reductase